MQRIKNNKIKFDVVRKKVGKILNDVGNFTKSIPGVQCKAGCSTCCKNFFPHGTLAEAAFIVAYLNENPSVVARIDKKALLKFHDNHDDLIEKYFPKDAPNFKDEASLRQYRLFTNELRKTAPACPFLSGDGCLIYEARPAVCRVFVSTTRGGCESFNPHLMMPAVLSDQEIIGVHQRATIDLCLAEYELAEKLVSTILTYKLSPEQMPSTSAMAAIPRNILIEKDNKVVLRVWENSFILK